MNTLFVDRKALGEVRGYEEVFMCMTRVILAGLEQRFPGIYSFLRLKALTRYRYLPDEVMLNDPTAFVELLEEMLGNGHLLETTIANILAELTKENRELTRALLSKDETELYIKLASSNNSTLLKTCKELLK